MVDTARALGKEGLNTFPVGLGCMGMSYAYGPADADEAVNTIRRALDLGVNFLDTADMYAAGANETLLGEAIAGIRDHFVVATKFGIVVDPGTFEVQGVDGSPGYVRSAIEGSLRRLGVDHVDLYYQHRPDPRVPIEETVGAMAALVAEGKVRYLGLSEASAQTIRRAAAVHPIAAVQTEWSLFSRDIEDEIVPTCRELGIGLVPYSPLGRGLLTGTIAAIDDLADDDFRRTLPRWQADNLAVNINLVSVVRDIATERGVPASQIALAWLLHQGDDVVPIPGTKRRRFLEENVGSISIVLDQRDLSRLSALKPAGDRYPDMSWTSRDTATAVG